MFRSLSSRAIVPVTLAVTGFVAVCCVLLYGVIKRDFIANTVQQEQGLAGIIIKASRDAMLRGDRESVRAIVANVGAQQGLEHLRIFNHEGRISFSRNQCEIRQMVNRKNSGCIGCHPEPLDHSSSGSMEKARIFHNECGTEIIAITAPILNEPECANAACHVHPADLKVLGTLDIGINAQHMRSHLTALHTQMIIFTLMVLFLTVGGVTALLQRGVFLPIQRLAEFTASAKHGTIGGTFRAQGSEIGAIADDFQALARELEQTRTELARLQAQKQGQPDSEPPKGSDAADPRNHTVAGKAAGLPES